MSLRACVLCRMTQKTMYSSSVAAEGGCWGTGFQAFHSWSERLARPASYLETLYCRELQLKRELLSDGLVLLRIGGTISVQVRALI